MNDDLRQRFRMGRPLCEPAAVIDMHGHLGRYKFGIPDLDPANLVAGMDRLGVAAVVCSHMQCMSSDVAWGNDQVAAAMQAHPQRILGYFSVWPKDRDSVAAETQRVLDLGFIGLKVHNTNRFAYDNPAYEPAYAAVNDRCMPVLFHTWGGQEEFAQIARLARRYPDVSILLAHTGSANTADYCRMAHEHTNVFLDLTLSLSPRHLVRDLVDSVGSGKIVWGSDAIFLNMAQQVGKVVDAQIDEAAKRRILIENAQRLLNRIRR